MTKHSPIEVTSSSIGPFHGLQSNHYRAIDAPISPDLLNPIPLDQEIGSVTVDGAYDIFRDHGAAWRAANAGHISLNQFKVMSAIERCRTAALGGHVA
jgi:hypothetical protein